MSETGKKNMIIRCLTQHKFIAQ